MNIARILYVIAVMVLVSPAMGAEASGRDAAGKNVAAPAATHSCPAGTDADGKVRCRCAPAQGDRESYEPVFTDAG